MAACGDPAPDVSDLAAAYGYGLTRNHGFTDGNKRTGWILSRLFLEDNQVKIAYSAHEAIQLVLGVADGSATEQQFAQWFRIRQVT